MPRSAAGTPRARSVWRPTGREEPEVREVGHPGPEDPEPDDREPGPASGLRGLPRPFENEGEATHDEQCERDLEHGRDHRREAADVPPGVHVAQGVETRRAEQREHAGDRPAVAP